MQTPICIRKGIPFFHDKSELEFKQDIYERYDDMVVRQSALHLADKFWNDYPFQPVLDFGKTYYTDTKEINILEIGCGVGRWIASVAKLYPIANCWGIDYSYQMLKRAKEFWVDSQEILIDLSDKGLGRQSLMGEKLTNLNFGLAKTEALPFDEHSQDLVLSSFLLDRLDDPFKGLGEVLRVLKPSGRLVMVTPLNFQKAHHWEKLHPTNMLSIVLKELGFDIVDWQEDITIFEPLDHHGNRIEWKCLGFVVEKK